MSLVRLRLPYAGEEIEVQVREGGWVPGRVISAGDRMLIAKANGWAGSVELLVSDEETSWRRPVSAIQLWPIDRAPAEARRVIEENGGLEDLTGWVFVVPRSVFERHGVPSFLHAATDFAPSRLAQETLENGDVVVWGRET